jgi:hypothetical protein
MTTISMNHQLTAMFHTNHQLQSGLNTTKNHHTNSTLTSHTANHTQLSILHLHMDHMCTTNHQSDHMLNLNQPQSTGTHTIKLHQNHSTTMMSPPMTITLNKNHHHTLNTIPGTNPHRHLCTTNLKFHAFSHPLLLKMNGKILLLMRKKKKEVGLNQALNSTRLCMTNW